MADGQAILEPLDGGTDVLEQEPLEQQETPEPQPEQQAGESDNKFSKRFSDWLKTVNPNNDPEAAKFARHAKDQEGRFFALKQLEPRGIDGVRDTYTALQSLQHGELKGIEAIGAIQDQIHDYEQSDELLASGDPKVLDLFGDDFNEGLGKLTPAILSRIQQSNPTAYSAAILPHLMSALETSPMLQGLNQIAAVLNEQPPSWLTADQKTAWTNDKFGKIINSFNSISTWYDAQDKAAKEGGAQKTGAGRAAAPQDQLSQERQAFEKERQEHYWKTNIAPSINQHAENTFNSLFAGYDKRLKLSPDAKKSLAADFTKGVMEKSLQNRQYTSQIGRYRSQKNPDAGIVSNLAKVEFSKHAKAVLESLVDSRGYRSFLNGSKPAVQQGPNGKFTAAVQNGEKVVSVMPDRNNVDYQSTPVDWLNTKQDGSKKFRMKDGSTVVYRPNR